MARQSRVEGILNVTPEMLMNMSRKDLAKNVSILASAANKRIKRMNQSGEYSPAVDWVRTHGGNFSVAGKDKNQLLIEFFRVQQFLESKTSTVRGAKKWQRSVKKEVSKAIKGRLKVSGEGGKTVDSALNAIFNDPKKRDDFWDLYSRITAEYDVKSKYKEIWDDIANAMTIDKNADVDDLFEFITESYEKKYQLNAPKDSGNELLLTDDVRKSIKEIATGEVL